jgi:uncharacterized protein YukJ
MNKYCLFKGELVNAAPFRPAYKGSPHYVINVRGLQGEIFKYVVNAASDEVGQDRNNNVYFYKDVAFSDPVTATLSTLPSGVDPAQSRDAILEDLRVTEDGLKQLRPPPGTVPENRS